MHSSPIIQWAFNEDNFASPTFSDNQALRHTLSWILSTVNSYLGFYKSLFSDGWWLSQPANMIIIIILHQNTET